MLFGVGVPCRILYSIVSCCGSITSVGGERSSIGVGLAPFQDGRSKMAAMAPIQAQIRVTTSDDPVTRSVSPRKVS